MEDRINMEPCEANKALFDRICEIFDACGLDPVVPFFATGGSDAADMTFCGIHSPGEYTLIPSIAYSAKMMASIVLGI